MVKFLKRLTVFIFVSFIIFNTIIFLVLNSPIIQSTTVNYINKNFLESYKLKLDLNSLNLGFFSTSLNLNGVSIQDISTADITKDHFNFAVSQISLKFNITKSYLSRKPILQKIIINGLSLKLEYDKSGNLILPEIFKPSKDRDEFKFEKIFKLIYPKIPDKIQLTNFEFTFGNQTSKRYQQINIDRIDLLKEKEHQAISVLLKLNRSLINAPQLEVPFDLQELDLKAEISNKGFIDIEKLNLTSNLANIDASIKSQLENEINSTNYEINLKKAEIFAHDFFKDLGKNSSGVITLQGIVHPLNNYREIPEFHGNVSWKNLFLENFLIYSGKADATFENKIIKYTNAKVELPKGGEITAHGKYELFGHYNFYNTAVIKNLSFEQLLKGFGIEKSPVEFIINTEEAQVDGKIFDPNPKKNFDLLAKSNITASDLQVTSFNQNKRSPLPNGKIALNLEANSLGILFDNSKIYLLPPKKTESLNNPNNGDVSIPFGKIDFTQKIGAGVNFQLNGKHVTLSSLDYFLGFHQTGFADLNGKLYTKENSSEVMFDSHVKADDGNLFDIHFKNLISDIFISEKGISFDQTSLQLQSKNNKYSSIQIKKSNINFNDLFAEINSNIYGSIDGIFSNLDKWVPTPFTSTSGKIEKFQFNMKGPLLHLSKWNLESNIAINELHLLKGNAQSFQANLNCKDGACSKSNISIQNISSDKNLLSRNGDAFFEINNLSFTDASFKSRIQLIPLEIFDVLENIHPEGYLNINNNFIGKWNKIDGFLKSQINNFKINNIDLGNVNINLKSINKESIEIAADSFNKQFYANISFPQEADKHAKININFNKFDLSQMLNSNTFFTSISGSFNFQGPLKNSAIKEWNGEGQLSSVSAQVGNLIFNSPDKPKITLKSGNFDLDKIELKSQAFQLDTSCHFNILSDEIELPISLDANLSLLVDSFPDVFVYPTFGRVFGTVNLAGPLKSLNYNGNIRVAGDSLNISYLGSPLKKIEGAITFKNKLIEIQRISASKENGDLGLAGYVDLNKSSPEMNLTLNASKLHVTPNIPIFLTTNMTLDADLNITGNSIPYLITGDISVRQLSLNRDLDCNQVTKQFMSMPKQNQTIISNPSFMLDINLKAMNTVEIQSQCIRGRFSTDPVLTLSGSKDDLKLNGSIVADTASIQLLKTNFDVKKGQLQFTPTQKFQPNVDLEMQGKVNTYNIYFNLNGILNQAKLDLSSDPSILPNGDRIIEADIISMISTGQVPQQSSNTNIFSATSAVASMLGFGTFLDTPMNNTINTLTAGLVDSISLSPSSQNGQLGWRANASRSISRRLDLGIDYEDGGAGSAESAYANFMINNTVSAISSYNSTNYFQQLPTRELYGGLKFQFGTQR